MFLDSFFRKLPAMGRRRSEQLQSGLVMGSYQGVGTSSDAATNQVTTQFVKLNLRTCPDEIPTPFMVVLKMPRYLQMSILFHNQQFDTPYYS